MTSRFVSKNRVANKRNLELPSTKKASFDSESWNLKDNHIKGSAPHNCGAEPKTIFASEIIFEKSQWIIAPVMRTIIETDIT